MDPRDQIQRDGYAVVRGLLSPQDIDRLRESFEKAATGSVTAQGNIWKECDCGEHVANAAAACPSTGWLFSHQGILDSVREALGRHDVVFTGNCDMHRSKLGDWHKDMGRIYGGYLADESSRSDDCSLVKVGVYLQDHDQDGRGFFVRTGSHRGGESERAEPTYVPTRAGDVLLFDPRLTHCGMPPDPIERLIWRVARRLGSDGATSPLGRWAKSAWWKLRGKPNKLSIFFTYGAPNSISEEFSRAVKSPALPARLSPELVDTLHTRGVATYSCS